MMMNWRLRDESLKKFVVSVKCLAAIGNDLILQAATSQLVLRTRNSLRPSAYHSITLNPSLFDTYTVTGSQVLCSVLMKEICVALATTVSSIDNLNVIVLDPGESKLQLTLYCKSGLKKTYWIACNVEVDEACDRRVEINDQSVVSQHHLSNWVEDDDNDETDDDSEPYVQATPPYYRRVDDNDDDDMDEGGGS